MSFLDSDIVVVSFARTAIGSFNGSLAHISAPKLGAIAIKGALNKLRSKLPNVEAEVEECIMGNVLSAGLGQGPARQACLFAGLGANVSCTTVNKVCSSGMKAFMMGVQQLQGHYRSKLVVVGGFESMSRVPYYLQEARFGKRMQHMLSLDGMICDGLWDPYGDQHMGSCAEHCSIEEGIPREPQDDYAVQSFKRAQAAINRGFFNNEIVPCFQTKNGKPFSIDESATKLDENKLRKLPAAFRPPQAGTEPPKDAPGAFSPPLPETSGKYTGRVTAGNASGLSDGGAALIITTGKYAKENGLDVHAIIRGMADYEHEPVRFPTAPAGAVETALARAALKPADVELYEFNEAFAVVPLANAKKLGLKDGTARVNRNGGAISLGHPLGMSGARIILTLISSLQESGQKIGVAGICNGGGGGSAVVLEALPRQQLANNAKL